jgi:hypothetical protein
MDNNIEHYRSGFNSAGPMSTMGEWMVPCDRCGSKSGAGRYWQCLGEMNIDRKGLICDRCKQRIDPQHPDARWVHHRADGQYESYRIPLMLIGVPFLAQLAICRFDGIRGCIAGNAKNVVKIARHGLQEGPNFCYNNGKCINTH